MSFQNVWSKNVKISNAGLPPFVHHCGRDTDKALEYYQEIASSEDSNAQDKYNLAKVLLDKNELEHDFVEAEKWMEMSSGENNPNAINGLGHLKYVQGRVAQK